MPDPGSSQRQALIRHPVTTWIALKLHCVPAFAEMTIFAMFNPQISQITLFPAACCVKIGIVIC
jgi:hypothetical protein